MLKDTSPMFFCTQLFFWTSSTKNTDGNGTRWPCDRETGEGAGSEGYCDGRASLKQHAFHFLPFPFVFGPAVAGLVVLGLAWPDLAHQVKEHLRDGTPRSRKVIYHNNTHNYIYNSLERVHHLPAILKPTWLSKLTNFQATIQTRFPALVQSSWQERLFI